ncbi:uncharacterized protein JCM10292_005384 [Rhodotorula paludigena]|uniref:uncharacterized protein n=1 Tax=Rhodotorula paludigena TaxID=86838 RepID=UPI00316F2181
MARVPVRDPLPLLPLPPDHSLFPSLVISIQLSSRAAVALVRSVVNSASSSSSGQPATSPLVIGCVPLKATNSVANTLSDAANRAPPAAKGADDAVLPPLQPDGNPTRDEQSKAKSGLQIIRVPHDADSQLGKLEDGKPDPGDLFEFGTLARIVRLERVSGASGGGFLVVVEGLARFSFSPSALDPAAPFYSASVTTYYDADATQLGSSDAALLASLRDSSATLLDSLQSASPLPPLFARRLRSLHSRLTFSSAPAFVDSLFGTLPRSTAPSSGLTHSDKLFLLSLVDPVARVRAAVEIVTRVTEALKLSSRIDERVGKSLARRQREHVLLQQLLAIRQELEELAAEDGRAPPAARRGSGQTAGTGQVRRKLPSGRAGGPAGQAGASEDDEDEDDLAELEKKLEAKSFSDEARKIAVRELKRLKKTPPQGAEHGVIRNYLDTLLAIPWTSAEATPLALSKDFVARARKKLDDDHYGLDKIKKRLLEWLAVLRLQQEAWDADIAASSAATPGSITESVVAETAVVLRDPNAPPAPDVPPMAPVVAAKPSHPPYKAPILLLHGPPGTGKTSIARSLADAMGRKFVRVSLGGVRDEAEIRGHRRTYVGAMPGKIVGALRKCGVSNPVVLLDEVDKLGLSSHHGDPSAALLEVLDPEQNNSFEDHYLGVPLDLSQVLFIATANSLDTIAEPLYDRMEAIELSGYVHNEKLHIARQSLLPKQLKANALSPSVFSVSDETLLFLITHYTREAGVRSLERQIGAICRAKAVEYAEARDATMSGSTDADPTSEGIEEAVKRAGHRVEVTEADVERILGPSRWDPEELDKEGRIGVATGMAYQGSGNGGILHIETTHLPGSGSFALTGSLGDVISESARVALAWVKAHAYDLGIAPNREVNVFKSVDVHLHMPSGAVRKDGPSAGVAMVVAIVSLMRGIAPRKGVAMTGEVTLRGAVTPVGGIKEKVLAAHRASITRIIMPKRNKRDVEADLPQQVRDELEFCYVERIEDALAAAFDGGLDRLTGRTEEDREKDWEVHSHL